METESITRPYDHSIAVDWSQRNMAIAVLKRDSEKARVVDVPTSVSELKVFLRSLKGSKILTIEESSTSQWLYTELRDCVDRLIVCDPYRNRLLQDGPKNDKIDAEKLAILLRNGLLKEVFHNGSEYFHLRKLVSSYNDIVRSMVRFKNQRAAVLIAQGKSKRCVSPEADSGSFSLEALDALIRVHEERLEKFTAEFKRLKNTNKLIRVLTTIPGIKEKSAVKLLAIVIDPRRFPDKGRWLSYCGLVRHAKMSGGKSYGTRQPRYSRLAKSIFKTAAISCIGLGSKDNVFRKYYERLKKRGLPDYNARHAVARRIAVVALGILKTGLAFENRWEGKAAEK